MSDKPASPARGRKKTAPPAQQPPQEEVVVRLPLTDLYPFPDHPFQVRDDEEMKETIQSVKEYGVIVPAIVRPREEGGYEIVAGHRRKYACEQAGLDTMPVLIRNLDRDAATIIMVDSNLQRENILPSERAKAYKMKLEAIKRQGARNDLTSPKISAKLRSDDEIGQQMGVSGDTVRNYISLTNLVPELMQMVDDGKIALSPAYQIAALKPEEQQRQERSFNYRGEDLFRQKATLLYEETDQVTMEIVVATRTLELWLLEDMSLAVVSCVSVNYDQDGYITQYRTIKDTPVMDSELCLDLGELVEDLNGLCGPVYEHTQPVYEP